MPAVKHKGVKQAIEDHDKGLRPAVGNYAITNAEKKQARFRLLIHRKKDAELTEPAVDRYVAFATNMSTGRLFWFAPGCLRSTGRGGV